MMIVAPYGAGRAAAPSPPRRSSSPGFPSARRRGGSTDRRPRRAPRQRAAADRPRAATDSASCGATSRPSRTPRAPASCARCESAAIRERQLHVLVHGEVADQVERLEDEPDLPIPNARALGRRQSGTGCPSSRYSPCVGVSSRPRIESSVVLPHPEGRRWRDTRPAAPRGACPPARASRPHRYRRPS